MSHAQLAVRYEDGSLLSRHSLQQLLGQDEADGHKELGLTKQRVPGLVMAKYSSNDWLV